MAVTTAGSFWGKCSCGLLQMQAWGFGLAWGIYHRYGCINWRPVPEYRPTSITNPRRIEALFRMMDVQVHLEVRERAGYGRTFHNNVWKADCEIISALANSIRPRVY